MIQNEARHHNNKFKVIERRTGREINGAFVLLPEHDSAARTAMASYAEATNNYKIARWIRTWLHNIHRQRLYRKRTDRSMLGMSYEKD